LPRGGKVYQGLPHVSRHQRPRSNDHIVFFNHLSLKRPARSVDIAILVKLLLCALALSLSSIAGKHPGASPRPLGQWKGQRSAPHPMSKRPQSGSMAILSNIGAHIRPGSRFRASLGCWSNVLPSCPRGFSVKWRSSVTWRIPLPQFVPVD
jgi:hypothetical protein